MSYYSILGVPFHASPREIIVAYRKAASRYHPDKSKSPDSTHHFQLIGEAYQVLKDPSSRRNYDNSIGLKHPIFNNWERDGNSRKNSKTGQTGKMIEQIWNHWGRTFIVSSIENMCDHWLENVDKNRYQTYKK